jgi:MFS family permease
LLALNIGNDFGWAGWQVWSLAAAGSLLLAVFVRQERCCSDPMIHLDLLTSRAFLVAVFCGMVHMYAGQTVGFLMPLFLVNIQGYGAAMMGLMLLPSAVVRIFVSPFSGALSDKYGARLPAGVGMCALVATFVLLARLTQASPAWYIGGCLLLNGAGGGLMQSPILNSVIGSHDSSESGVISGLFNMTRFVGGMIGTAVAGIQVGDEMLWPGLVPPGPVDGFYQAFMTAAGLAAIGFFASRMLRSSRAQAGERPRPAVDAAGGDSGRL